jgi:hypothetical protein
LRAITLFVLFTALVAGVLVFVVVPYVAGPVISSVVSSSGFIQGGSVTVDTKGSGTGADPGPRGRAAPARQ